MQIKFSFVKNMHHFHNLGFPRLSVFMQKYDLLISDDGFKHSGRSEQQLKYHIFLAYTGCQNGDILIGNFEDNIYPIVLQRSN